MQGSISPTFYEHLLLAEIPKEEKDTNTDDLTVFLSIMGFFRVKAAHKMLVNLTPGVNFINVLRARFSYKRSSFCQNVTREKHSRPKNTLIKCW